MAGLGAVTESNTPYLSIAGGFIWNKKVEEGQPNYATQNFERADKTIGTRAGGRYADLTGKVVGVQFKVHVEYGESINVKIDAGEAGMFIISISTNNRYSQDFMKVLLLMDLTKDLFIKPYDFVGTDKKRAQGISFRQDGNKISLRVETPAEFQKEKDFWKTASKKEIKRYFEDLNDWFVAEVEEKVISKMAADVPTDKPPTQGLGAATEAVSQPADEVDPADRNVAEPASKPAETAKETTAAEPKITPIKMKSALKAYSAENYEGRAIPRLSRQDLEVWYNLSLNDEELPFEDTTEAAPAAVAGADLGSQLNSLLGEQKA